MLLNSSDFLNFIIQIFFGSFLQSYFLVKTFIHNVTITLLYSLSSKLLASSSLPHEGLSFGIFVWLVWFGCGKTAKLQIKVKVHHDKTASELRVIWETTFISGASLSLTLSGESKAPHTPLPTECHVVSIRLQDQFPLS